MAAQAALGLTPAAGSAARKPPKKQKKAPVKLEKPPKKKKKTEHATRAISHATTHDGCCPLGATAASHSAAMDEEEDDAERKEATDTRIRVLQLTLLREQDRLLIESLQRRPIMVDCATQTEEAKVQAPTYYHPGPVLIPGIYSCCHASMHVSEPGCTLRATAV